MYGMEKEKKKRDGMMYGGSREARTYGGMRDKKMYGGKAKQGAQPMYGSTVADAMPKTGAN